MPIYEYQCQSCGYELEALQKVSDPVLTKCPECAVEKLQKQVSAAGFRLKGTGWYETDFKDKSTESGKKSDSTSKGESDAAISETKTTSNKSSAEKSVKKEAGSAES